MEGFLLIYKGISLKVLVYGHYGHANIGDELFKEAFQTLFPDFQFTFTDQFTESLLREVQIVFIGGGSFLESAPVIKNNCLNLLKSKKIYYIGVGSETDLHPIHQQLMSTAQLIAIRNVDKFDDLKLINPNVIVIPDIVFSLKSKIVQQHKIDKSVLILPNIYVVPQHNEPHWKHQAWNYFKSEFSQFLDLLIEEKYQIKFLSMCQHSKLNDDWAAIEIINLMKHRENYFLQNDSFDFQKLSFLISPFQKIITQRFHGIILSELLDIPYISLYHHDKLKGTPDHRGLFINYYGMYKKGFFKQFENLQISHSALPIESNMFDILVKQVRQSING
jgi:polysaccharide pyruvyl transferase WcaK-like protein